MRTSLDSKSDLWVGQRTVLIVELLAPGYFSGTAAFDLPNVPGMVLAPPPGSPVVSSETIDGVSYTIQRHEVSIFARRGGPQTIPPFAVRFHFKRNPLDKDAVAVTVKTAAVPFTAKVPPGAEKLGNVISARNLKVEESWKPEPGPVMAGAAFTRTITFSAPNVPAMAFPPFPAGKIEGLGIYPKAPEVLDHDERGELSGKRRDTITYVCQRPGHVTIPAVRLTWFDLEAQKLKVIDLPAHTFDIAPNPALATATAAAEAAAKPDGSRPAIMGLMAALGLCGLIVLIGKTSAHWLPWVLIFRPVHLAPLNPEDRTDLR